jgi:glycine oxidase
LKTSIEKVVVVGGGVIGVLTAIELAQRGVVCEILEAGKIGAESSWAGGGIVSPLYPWRYSKPVTELALWAQDYYPALVDNIIAETGSDPELYNTGLLMLDAEDHQQALAWGREFNRPMEEWDSAAIAKQEPRLGAGFSKGLWMPTIGNIRNPRLMNCLRLWCEKHPLITIREQSPVTGMVQRDGRVRQVISQNDTVAADAVVIACGAWSNRLLAQQGITLPVEPVRGQMLLFHSDTIRLNTMVLHNGKYIIPRRDGHLLVGSTLEKVGFDKRTTKQAYNELMQQALKLVPELKQLELKRQWAGLRPGSPQGVPFISPVPRFDNVFVNAGHYRNGLVLAPASARLMCDLILQNKPIIDPEPYRLAEYV